MKTSFFTIALLFAVASSNALSVESNNLDFRVFLDDKEIGFHQVRITGDPGSEQVKVKAKFDVKLWIFNAYSYDHQATESWQGGCISKLETTTDDNGEHLFVSSKRTVDGLKVESQDDSTLLPGCVRTFAYWNPKLLQVEELLNTQTGEYEAVSFNKLGSSQLKFGDQSVETEHYELTMEDHTINLYYSSTNEWLALKTKVDGGRILSYLRRDKML